VGVEYSSEYQSDIRGGVKVMEPTKWEANGNLDLVFRRNIFKIKKTIRLAFISDLVLLLQGDSTIAGVRPTFCTIMSPSSLHKSCITQLTFVNASITL